MIRPNTWFAALAGLGFLWQECGEDFVIFCYRIGCSILALAHQQALQLVPVRPAISGSFARTKAACSNPSFTFSTPSMIRRDFEN